MNARQHPQVTDLPSRPFRFPVRRYFETVCYKTWERGALRKPRTYGRAVETVAVLYAAILVVTRARFSAELVDECHHWARAHFLELTKVAAKRTRPRRFIRATVVARRLAELFELVLDHRVVIEPTQVHVIATEVLGADTCRDINGEFRNLREALAGLVCRIPPEGAAG